MQLAHDTCCSLRCATHCSDAERQELLQEQQQHGDVVVVAPASPALAANSSRRADKLRSRLAGVLREHPAVEWVIRMGE